LEVDEKGRRKSQIKEFFKQKYFSICSFSASVGWIGVN
jgi:hypothetical protein